jgi:hypothetical protein
MCQIKLRPWRANQRSFGRHGKWSCEFYGEGLFSGGAAFAVVASSHADCLWIRSANRAGGALGGPCDGETIEANEVRWEYSL